MAIDFGRSSTPQGQIEELDRQIAGFNGTVPAHMMSAVQDMYNRRNALASQLNRQRPAPVDPMAAQRDKIMQLTEGRADELRKDPVHGSVMDYLKGVLSGNDTPYNDTTMNALQAQSGKGFADREAAQMQQLRDSLQATGGSIYDPSYQAASREAESKRMGANLDYAGQLAGKANLANFDARSQAARQMDASNSAQNQQITNLGLSSAGYRARDFQDQSSGSASPAQTLGPILMPQYQPQMQQSAAPAPATAQPKPAAAAPKPAAAPTPGFQGGQGVPYPYVAPPAQPANPKPSYVQLSGQPDTRQYIGVPNGQQIVQNAIWNPKF